MAQSNELRVFISSTFRDLQEEREHLIKKIFPEIRSLCRARGITFTEVDLRWGLTEEDVALGQVIRTCLEEIDKCRPYFIGITGDRYGYVPELHEYYKDASLLQTYPWIEDAAMNGASIIDLEFRHAVMNNGQPTASGAEHTAAKSTGHRACFFFRRQRRGQEIDVDDVETQRLDQLKQRVRDAALPVEEFRDAGTLGEMVHDALMEIIDRDFAEVIPPTPLEEERARHRAFAVSRRRAYIPSAEYLTEINDWFANDEQPLVIYAESGSGKSSLISFWCDQLQRRQPELPIVEHYVGIGAGAVDHLAIMRHVMSEIKQRFDRVEELPEKPEDIEKEFGNWLGFNISPLPQGEGPGVRVPLLLVIDGINQLEGHALNLHWLPPTMPVGVKLIISSTVEQTLVTLRNRRWRELGMQPLKEREREAVVVRFLSEYRKALSTEQLRRIAEDMKCAHPLFLRTMLEELRIDSSHEQLDERINYYLKTTGTEDLFQKVLERMEDDYSQRMTREVMTNIWGARAGLSESELADLTGISRLKLSSVVMGLDYHLVRKDGRLTFFHDYLRRAVEKRYCSESSVRRSVHLRLSEYFQRAVDAAISENQSIADIGQRLRRLAEELTYQLHQAEEWARLGQTLATIPIFMALFDGGTVFEVLAHWAAVREAAERSQPKGNDAQWMDVERAYRTGLERWKAQDDEEQSAVLDSVADVLQRLSHWDAARTVLRERLTLANSRGKSQEEADTGLSLAWLSLLQGDISEALEQGQHALRLCTELDDQRGVAGAMRTIGSMHYTCGELDEALQCYQQWATISREHNDRRELARAYGAFGNVYSSRGNYDAALDAYRQQEELTRELGDRVLLAKAVGNIAGVFISQGDYTEALECFNRALSVVRELGDRVEVAHVLSGIGSTYCATGDTDRGLEFYHEAIDIYASVGSSRGLSETYAHISHTYIVRGDYEESLHYAQKCEDIHRKLGDPRGLITVLYGRGSVYSHTGEVDAALKCYRELAVLANEIGDEVGIAGAAGNIGALLAGRGEYQPALESLTSALEQHRSIGVRHGVVEWLNVIAQLLFDLVAGTEAGQSDTSGTLDSMPAYLPTYVPGATDATWRVMSLQLARAMADECNVISEEIQWQDTIVRSRVLLARLDGIEGHRDRARQQLLRYLNEAVHGVQPPPPTEDVAEYFYWLWYLGEHDSSRSAPDMMLPEDSPTADSSTATNTPLPLPSQVDLHHEALRCYTALLEKTPKHLYRLRLNSLNHS